MSKDKYSSIFSFQMKAIVHIFYKNIEADILKFEILKSM